MGRGNLVSHSEGVRNYMSSIIYHKSPPQSTLSLLDLSDKLRRRLLDPHAYAVDLDATIAEDVITSYGGNCKSTELKAGMDLHHDKSSEKQSERRKMLETDTTVVKKKSRSEIRKELTPESPKKRGRGRPKKQNISMDSIFQPKDIPSNINIPDLFTSKLSNKEKDGDNNQKLSFPCGVMVPSFPLNCQNIDKNETMQPLTPVIVQTPERGRGRGRRGKLEESTHSEGNLSLVISTSSDTSEPISPSGAKQRSCSLSKKLSISDLCQPSNESPHIPSSGEDRESLLLRAAEYIQNYEFTSLGSLREVFSFTL